MYEFRDTNIGASQDDILPSEALSINGEYIETLIPGYKTLCVCGREALSPELSTYETGVSDGSVLKSRRYPARTITVKYQLKALANPLQVHIKRPPPSTSETRQTKMHLSL